MNFGKSICFGLRHACPFFVSARRSNGNTHGPLESPLRRRDERHRLPPDLVRQEGLTHSTHDGSPAAKSDSLRDALPPTSSGLFGRVVRRVRTQGRTKNKARQTILDRGTLKDQRDEDPPRYHYGPRAVHPDGETRPPRTLKGGKGSLTAARRSREVTLNNSSRPMPLR